MSLLLSLIALTVVGAMWFAGDRIFKRQSPAVRLVYQVSEFGGGTSDKARAAVMAVLLKRRFDRQEMRDVQVRNSGTTIEVLAPASVPKPDVKRVLSIGGALSFHVVAEDPTDPSAAEMLARMREGGAGPQPQPGDQLRWLPCAQEGISPLESSGSDGVSYILVHTSPDRSMTHDDPNRPWSVKKAQPVADQNSSGAAVAFQLDRRGAERFGELTGAHVGKRLAIVLDGHVLSAPRINTRIEGHGIINGPPGGFTQQEAIYLASTLNAGALPAQLADQPLSEEYLTMPLGLSPFTRYMLRWSAIALAVAAACLCSALLVLRRLHPTVHDQESALRSLGLYNET